MTGFGAGPRHLVRTGHRRQPHLGRGLRVQAQLHHTAQDLPALLADQLLYLRQRHRLARRNSQPDQPSHLRPQPRDHRIGASRQRIQPVPFHLRLPFHGPDFALQDHTERKPH